MAYELFRQSVQGAGHIKKGMPCEDFGIKVEDANCKIFALGDGHGDANCPRSSYGSQSVCEIAAQELQTFANAIKEQGWEERLLNRRDASELIRQLIASIFGKWSCRVNDDFEANPLTEKEETEAKDYIERYKKGERIEHIYGTTLIAGLLTDRYLLLLQQGDGRCVVFDSEGEASQPIPWDDRCFSNVTTSVCDTDAVQSCRYHIIDLQKNPIIACVAGSDGVEDSFGSMDKMHTYYREKMRIACEKGVDALEQHLAESLPEFSAEGSQDDVTICGIIDRELFTSKLDKIIAANEAVIINDSLNKAQERIDSMTPKLMYLDKRRADSEAAYLQLQKKLAKLQEEDNKLRTFLKNLARIREDKEALEKELQAALEKKNLCAKEYAEYKQKFDGFVNMKREYAAKSGDIEMPGNAGTVDAGVGGELIKPADSVVSVDSVVSRESIDSGDSVISVEAPPSWEELATHSYADIDELIQAEVPVELCEADALTENAIIDQDDQIAPIDQDTLEIQDNSENPYEAIPEEPSATEDAFAAPEESF